MRNVLAMPVQRSFNDSDNTHKARTTDNTKSTVLTSIHKHTAGTKEKKKLNIFTTYSANNDTLYNTAGDTVQYSAQTNNDTYTNTQK